jgi:hypothetical protein
MPIEARAYPRPLPNSEWLGKPTEEILEPDLPIVDPAPSSLGSPRQPLFARRTPGRRQLGPQTWGRGPRHAGSAPARHSGSAEADAQASQEARICAEVAGHRQAALLRVGIPPIRADLPSRARDQAQQSSRELPSDGATTRAQGAAVKVDSLRTALPKYARRRREYAYEYNPLFDPDWQKGEAPHEVGRARFGPIVIANSDSAAAAYTDAAIDQAHRAVQV